MLLLAIQCKSPSPLIENSTCLGPYLIQPRLPHEKKGDHGRYTFELRSQKESRHPQREMHLRFEARSRFLQSHRRRDVGALPNLMAILRWADKEVELCQISHEHMPDIVNILPRLVLSVLGLLNQVCLLCSQELEDFLGIFLPL